MHGGGKNLLGQDRVCKYLFKHYKIQPKVFRNL